MADEVFSFISNHVDFLNYKEPILSTRENLACIWSCESDDDKSYFVWEFNWAQLTDQGIKGFTGEIVLDGIYTEYDIEINPIKIEVDLSNDNRIVKHAIGNDFLHNYSVHFTYTLIPIVSMTEVYDEMFLPSEKHDAVLEVDGMQLHVNKSFLSYHSDFFAALFSSKFKEGQLSEIPIEDVTYEEIGLLFSAFYPKAVFPNDRTIPKLLELADRFLLPSVIHHVEYHLLNNSKIENEKMTWMADRYGMELLLEKMIIQLDTVVKAKKLKASSDYMQLSDNTKARILDKVMCII